MHLKPIFVTDIDGVILNCDCTFAIPKSNTNIKLEWSGDGIFISCVGGATAYLIEGESYFQIDKNKYLHRWHEDKRNYRLDLLRTSGDEPFAAIYVSFISDETEWITIKKDNIKNMAAIFQVEIKDIEEHIVEMISISKGKSEILDYVQEQIKNFNRLEGQISSSYNCVLERWKKVAYMLMLEQIASDSGNNPDKILSEIKKYLSNKR